MQTFQIRAILEGDRVSALSLGKQEYAPLKTFLKKYALGFHLANIAKTYVLIDKEASPRVWGYVSLMCSEITLDSTQRPAGSGPYDTFPAIKMARLAIDKAIQGQGRGISLVKASIALIKNDITPLVGCRFLTVDSKPEAIPFYERLGFTLLDTADNKKNPNPLMLLDLNTIAVERHKKTTGGLVATVV